MKDEKDMQKKLEELIKSGNEQAERVRKLSGREKDALKQQMLDRIWHGGAWFTTRTDNFMKIAYSAADECLFARECVLREGTLIGGAYTFGTDWFDISFHGRRIDIYCDPETFRSWEIVYDPDRGTMISTSEGDNEPPAPVSSAKSQRLLKFCSEADQEVLGGAPSVRTAYHIDGAPFAKTISLSEGAE